MTLQDAIQHAAAMAYEDDADQYVVRGDDRQWRTLHNEDPEAFAPGITDRFLVHSDGVDVGHIQRGEITEDWELPE